MASPPRAASRCDDNKPIPTPVRSMISPDGWGASAFNLMLLALPQSASKISVSRERVTVPFRVAPRGNASGRAIRTLAGMVMIKWDSVFEWGRRASDRPIAAPVTQTRDPLLESAIAHEQIEVLYQPLIEPLSGRTVGAEALARSAIARSATALFGRAAAAGLDERLSRLVQRKALRSAAVWEGALKELKLSINLLPADVS